MQQLSRVENMFLNLPYHITIDILSRLSTKTLSRCRCVWKLWLKLISEPEFSNFRLLRSPTTTLMIHKIFSSSFNLVELEDEPKTHDFYFVPGSKIEHPKSLSPNSKSMFGSVNGLISFREYGYHNPDTVYIWNPSTRESISIQSAGGVMEYPNITTYGFGFSLKTGQYKVVRIYQEILLEGDWRRISKSDCHVYTLGSQGCWRYTGHAPFLYNCRMHGLFLNGNLHWLIQNPDGREVISCFDLEKESFHPFPPPPELDDNNLATLDLYQNCLSVCDNTSDFDIVIWVMKEYGVKKSWFKQFVIDKHPIDLVGQYYEVVQILKVFRDGEILLILGDDRSISYNSNSNTLQLVDIFKFLGTPIGSYGFQERHPCIEIEAIDYASSFLSLKSFKGERVENTFED